MQQSRSEAKNQVSDILEKVKTPRYDPPEKVQRLFYKPILGQIEQSPRLKIVENWNIFQDFESEMSKVPEEMFQKYICEVKTFVEGFLEMCLGVGYGSQDGRSIYTMMLNYMYFFLLDYWRTFPISFRPRLCIDFGIQDPEAEEYIPYQKAKMDVEDNESLTEEEAKEPEIYQDPPRTRPQDNVALCFGDLDSTSKSVFTDLYTAFVVKCMDKNCLFETQVDILSTYLQILSKAENRNVYYGLLTGFDTRIFFKYNRDEATLFKSETFNIDLEDLYLNQHWSESEETFYRLLAAICFKFLSA